MRMCRVYVDLAPCTMPQVLHANHLVYQPVVCADVCEELGVPFIIFPHGSSIEYTVLADDRFKRRAKHAVSRAALVISGSQEVADRIEALYDDSEDDQAALAAFRAKQAIVGVGTDTSLFRTVGFGKRSAKIANVNAFEDMFGGKNPGQRQELRDRLDATTDTSEWHTILRSYKTAYNHKLPDTDFGTRLTALPWAHRRHVSQAPMLMFLGAMTVGKGIQTLIVAFAELLRKCVWLRLLAAWAVCGVRKAHH